MSSSKSDRLRDSLAKNKIKMENLYEEKSSEDKAKNNFLVFLTTKYKPTKNE